VSHQNQVKESAPKLVKNYDPFTEFITPEIAAPQIVFDISATPDTNALLLGVWEFGDGKYFLY